MTNANIIKSSALNVHSKYKKSRIFHIIARNQAKTEDHKLFQARIVSLCAGKLPMLLWCILLGSEFVYFLVISESSEYIIAIHWRYTHDAGKLPMLLWCILLCSEFGYCLVISESSECIIALQRTCTLVVGRVFALNESESVKWSGGKYLSRDYVDHFSANERPALGHTDQWEGLSVTRRKWSPISVWRSEEACQCVLML